jgi:hypothetical protein
VQVLDFVIASYRHWRARLWRRLTRSKAPVWTFVEEVDFARFCRDLDQAIDCDFWKRFEGAGEAWPEPWLDLDDFGDDLHPET